MLTLLYLSSGLFLGWSLGANDASNIFGTAVGTRMLKFKTAAIIGSLFVILGAVISGAGVSQTIGNLGAVNRIAGAFMVALSAGLAVYWMTRLRLPVSTSQAIVGAIIGWSLFARQTIHMEGLFRIALSWIISPILAAIFSLILFLLFKKLTTLTRIHMLRLDAFTRLGLIIVGAFGAYALGANNIGNVMGVFITVSPFSDLDLAGMTFSGTQQLFLLGGIAIAIGIFTYSKNVMLTVGTAVVKMSPQAALVVVLADALVLFLFASRGLEAWLHSHALPTIPLVPLSSSQLVVGAILGIGIAHGGRGIQYRELGKIASGWISTPLLAAVIAFVALFFLQNVFDQEVFDPLNVTQNPSVIVDIISTLPSDTIP